VIILQLQQATHATLHLLTAELAHLDLAASDINALGNLGDGVARTVSELGAAVGSRPATMTGILDRLERRGLVRRAARPGDRRAIQIELTDDGARAATTIRQTLRDIERRALAGLPPDTVDGARTVLRALTQAGR
jgi:MarR family transcriptional regulator, organic hydroperoxide resistance regulator